MSENGYRPTPAVDRAGLARNPEVHAQRQQQLRRRMGRAMYGLPSDRRQPAAHRNEPARVQESTQQVESFPPNARIQLRVSDQLRPSNLQRPSLVATLRLQTGARLQIFWSPTRSFMAIMSSGRQPGPASNGISLTQHNPQTLEIRTRFGGTCAHDRRHCQTKLMQNSEPARRAAPRRVEASKQSVERVAPEKQSKQAKLPQRQATTQINFEHDWQDLEAAVREKRAKFPTIDLQEPVRSKVLRSLRKLPPWLVSRMDMIGASSRDLHNDVHPEAFAYARSSIFGNQEVPGHHLGVYVNEQRWKDIDQKLTDQTMCHEIAGHILESLIAERSPTDHRSVLMRWQEFGKAHVALMAKDGYSNRILSGNDIKYEAYLNRLAQQLRGRIDMVEIIQREREMMAFREFWANRMAEFILTAAGHPYEQTFIHRKSQFSDIENRKCWQLCSMMYQMGERLYTKGSRAR